MEQKTPGSNKDSNPGGDTPCQSVLIARFSALGDVALTIPVVYSACKCYPHVRFVMATRESMASLFINKPVNLEIEGINIKEDLSGMAGYRRVMKRLKAKYGFDTFIDLQNDASTRAMRLWCLLHSIKTLRLNHMQRSKRALARRTNKILLPLPSTRHRYKEVFFKAGMPLEETFGGLYGPGAKAPQEAFAGIIDFGKASGEQWIGLAPFALSAEKEYPTEMMEEVIKMLIARPRTTIFVFGGPGREEEIARRWAQTYPGVVPLAGTKYGFPAELALISNLDVMLTMDSANMHLASIAGTPAISIWGATHHYCGFKGWRQSESDMIQLPLPCRPCSVSGDKPCFRHDRLCLTAIRPETIYNKIIEKLHK